MSTPERKPSQADLLMKIANSADVDLFLSSGEVYATISFQGRRETHKLRSDRFRKWLKHEYYKRHGKAASSTQAMQDAIETLDGVVYETGITKQIYTRVAAFPDRVCLDLANERGEVVEVTAHGWHVTSQNDCKFTRPKGMLPLPVPQRGGNIEHEAAKFLGLRGEGLRLIIGWMLGFFQPAGARPILQFHGEQGSAKSSRTKLIRNTIDPNEAPTRSTPRDVRDLFIAAFNSAALAYDNISGLPDWLSDAFSSISTGQGHATKANYTDADEVIINVRLPIIMNGISNTGFRPDFLSRSILVELPIIRESERREEREIDVLFREVHPHLLGALLDAVSSGLKNLPHTKLDTLPRLADFAVWITACTRDLKWEKSFIDIFRENNAAVNDMATDASILARSLLDWINAQPGYSWQGRTQDLSKKLNDFVGEETRRRRDFPSTPEGLGKAMARIAPVLRAQGIQVESSRTNAGKQWAFTSIGDVLGGSQPTQNALNLHEPSQPTREPTRENPINHAGLEQNPAFCVGCDGSEPYYSSLAK